MTVDRIVLVTRETRLDGLLTRYGTRGNARFQIEQTGGDFSDYEDEDRVYREAVSAVRRGVDFDLPVLEIDRALVPTYAFSGQELIVTVGQDGLVANVARYVGAQPIVGVNPDPRRFDGVLLPFLPEDTRAVAQAVLRGKAIDRRVTLSEATLHDGQRLTAFNDLFIGAASHVSARYTITCAEGSEVHSSSGLLVATGAGSTGWLSSVFNMVSGVGAAFGREVCPPVRLEWDDPRLFWVAREPFRSRHSSARLVCGFIEPGDQLIVESSMAADGVIFGDGVERDYLGFNAGAKASIRASQLSARLVVSPS